MPTQIPEKTVSSDDNGFREVGHFELTLLSSIKALGNTAWGSNLQQHTSEVLGRDVAIGQLYLALSKLEAKGMISSEQKAPEAKQGGRTKKVFHVEGPGLKVLQRMAAIVGSPAHVAMGTPGMA